MVINVAVKQSIDQLRDKTSELINLVDQGQYPDAVKAIASLIREDVINTFDSMGQYVDQCIAASIEAAKDQLRSELKPNMFDKQKSIAESKVLINLRTLSSDKSEFKIWNDKLINAISQVFGSDWRVFMKALNQRLDETRLIMDDKDMQSIAPQSIIDKYDKINEDMYYVLVE